MIFLKCTRTLWTPCITLQQTAVAACPVMSMLCISHSLDALLANNLASLTSFKVCWFVG